MAALSAVFITGPLLSVWLLLLQGREARVLEFPNTLYVLAVIPFAMAAAAGRVAMALGIARTGLVGALRRVLSLACLGGLVFGSLLMFAWGLISLVQISRLIASA